MKSRDVGLRIKYMKTTEVEEIGIKEVIASYNHDFENKRIAVVIRLYNSKDELIREQNLIIEDELYSEVYNPEVNLQINDDNLWNTIDKIRET